MPFVTELDTGPIQHLPETAPGIDPSVGEVFGSAFRQENSLVSLATSETAFSDYQSEAGFDGLTDENLKGYEMFAQNFIDSKSPEQQSAIKQQIDQELEDKQTLAAGGVTGFVAMVAAGVTDPLFWAIPGFAEVKGAKTIGGAVLRVGAIGGVSEIPVEAAKQLTQEARTGEEAIFAIGGATILSGILGGTFKGLSNAEVKSISTKIDDVMSEADTPIVAGNAKSLSAAEAPTLTKDELQLVSVGGLESLGVSPLLRAENSPSVRTRQLSAEMMESATVKQANVDGKATIPEGGSAETRIKMWDAGLYQSLKELDEFYTSYRGGKGTVARTVNDYVMRNRAGKMTNREFREEVGKTMRRGDQSNIPEVQQAAESFRKNVIDPMKEAAIREKLLPPDIDVKTPTSPRVIFSTMLLASQK